MTSFYRNSIWFLLFSIVFFTSCTQNNSPARPKQSMRQQLVVATMGASLMYPENGWVEKACENQNMLCLNKAVSGENTRHFAQRLWKNEYATDEELSLIDILLIQFANCQDVYGDSTTLLPTADDYTRNYIEFSDTLFMEYSRAQQMDYILKKWQQICEEHNKPMHIIFVTHWHDGRTIYNESVRKLAKRWNADVCELDKNIGFTKDKPLPDGRQPSLLYAVDTEMIGDTLFGWHPLRGKEGEYIQSVMADILHEKLVLYVTTNELR